jgi:hypothetical protein
LSTPKFTDTSTHDYREFIEHLQASGYSLIPFAEADRTPSPFAVIRHDIDFDCELAYRIAAIETEMSVRSTFFFLISSESYNVASPKNREFINKIRDLGHEISIHFDPVIYENFVTGFDCERQFFEQLFEIPVETISIHRPTPFFLDLDASIAGIAHTYQKRFVESMKYFADSTGVWRYGHPANSPEFAERKNLHILIHPIWWTVSDEEADNIEKIRSHYLRRVEQVKKHYAENCKPFNEVYDRV